MWEELWSRVRLRLKQAETPSGGFRWMQLAMGIVCMAMIANLQYGWTLFVDPIDAKYHWGRAAIQLAFTLFVVTETWLVPVEAWFVENMARVSSPCSGVR